MLFLDFGSRNSLTLNDSLNPFKLWSQLFWNRHTSKKPILFIWYRFFISIFLSLFFFVVDVYRSLGKVFFIRPVALFRVLMAFFVSLNILVIFNIHKEMRELMFKIKDKEYNLVITKDGNGRSVFYFHQESSPNEKAPKLMRVNFSEGCFNIEEANYDLRKFENEWVMRSIKLEVKNEKVLQIFSTGDHLVEFCNTSKKNIISQNVTIIVSKGHGLYQGSVIRSSPKKGNAFYTSGDIYKGDWKDGKWEGQGSTTYSNGEKYEGFWKDGKMNGDGQFFYANGNKKYEGSFKHGMRYGGGITFWPDGLVEYVGAYKDDKKHGYGAGLDSDGGEYLGNWKSNNRDGLGTQTWASKFRYVGIWKDDARNGKGKLFHSDGKIAYEGDWKDGKRHGKGKSFFLDGTLSYVGNFKNDKKSGKGTFFFLNGTLVCGGEFIEVLFKGCFVSRDSLTLNELLTTFTFLN